LVIGGCLLIFGLQWLRKAVYARAAQALHDEDAIYAAELAAALAAPVGRRGVVATGTPSPVVQGCCFEGLEVVFIGSPSGPTSRTSARRTRRRRRRDGGRVPDRHAGPLPGPENTMKLVVGSCSLVGIFWGAEAPGRCWPAADAALLVIVPAVALYALLLIAVLRRAAVARRDEDSRNGDVVNGSGVRRVLVRLHRRDDWRVAVAVVAALAVT